MSIICMAVHDTEDNGRTEMTKKTINSLERTVNFDRNRMVVIDNGSCEETKDLLECFRQNNHNAVIIITLPENIGTAKAVNKGLQLRRPDEYAVKMDNDIVIYKQGWIAELEFVMRRMPEVGILGLKRPDLLETPTHINTDLRSRLLMVPHETGERWKIIETCNHVIGSCTMLSPQLLEKVGGFCQMDGLYGYDDCLMCVRSHVAGFLNAFLHGIDIDHIDPGGTDYARWKEEHAGVRMERYVSEVQLYRQGVKNIYEPL